MCVQSVAKLLLSFLYNPIALIRIGKVGRWCDIRKGLIVHSPSKIIIGNHVRIDRNSRLSCYAGGGGVLL